MITVGLLLAEIGGRAKWLIPRSFLGFMICGGIAGMTGWQIPGVEFGIATPIVFLGAAVAANKKSPMIVSLVFAGLFGLFHGHAHGTEMSALASPGPYASGFVVATTALHVFALSLGVGPCKLLGACGDFEILAGLSLERNLVCLSH